MLPNCVEAHVKNSSMSVVVWGCLSVYGTGDLVGIQGIMEKKNNKKLFVKQMPSPAV